MKIAIRNKPAKAYQIPSEKLKANAKQIAKKSKSRKKEIILIFLRRARSFLRNLDMRSEYKLLKSGIADSKILQMEKNTGDFNFGFCASVAQVPHLPSHIPKAYAVVVIHLV